MAAPHIDQAASIAVGARFPDCDFQLVSASAPAADGTCSLPKFTAVKSQEFLAGKKVVLLAVPGAFTPTCSEKHLPGFLVQSDALKAKGVQEVLCLSVNDKFVMHAWAQQFNTGARLTMIADPSATVAKALGLAFVAGDMGVRARRFAMVIENGTVTVCNVEAPGKFEVSSAESILSAL